MDKPTNSVEGTHSAVAETAKNSAAAHAGRFKKGQAKPKNSGRKPGSPNKIPADIKLAFGAAFAELQRDPKTELAAWARKSKANLRQFYVLCARALSRFEVTTNTQVNIDNREAPVDVRELARSIGFLLSSVQAEAPALPYSPEREKPLHPATQFVPALSSSANLRAAERARAAEMIRKQEVTETPDELDDDNDYLLSLALKSEEVAQRGLPSLPTSYATSRYRRNQD